MDFLTQKEMSGLKQDVKFGVTKQTAEKIMFEKKLLESLGNEMEEEIKNPKGELSEKKKKIAKKLTRKKRRTVWRENLRKILGIEKKEAV